MAVVAGVDFGTLSVRVSIVDSERGLLASALAEYPLHRKREDPEYATQSHEDHMHALAESGWCARNFTGTLRSIRGPACMAGYAWEKIRPFQTSTDIERRPSNT